MAEREQRQLGVVLGGGISCRSQFPCLHGAESIIDLVPCLVFHPLVPLTVSYDWLACHQWAFNACKPLSLSLSTKQLASSEALKGNASFADVPAVSDEPMASIEV